jgi:hypothetical protein
MKVNNICYTVEGVLCFYCRVAFFVPVVISRLFVYNSRQTEINLCSVSQWENHLYFIAHDLTLMLTLHLKGKTHELL